jgi:S1-C subfamily serine protease
MREHQRGHSSLVLVLMFVAGLIIGGIATAYVLSRQIDTLRGDISNVQSQLSSVSGLISSISGNQLVYNQTDTVYQNGTALSEIYEKVRDSVVVIMGTTSSGTVEGSGFLYNFSGSMVVVTNNHVVSGANDVSVTFSDGNGYAATVNGTDSYSDLAVLSVPGAAQVEFKPLVIADSSSLKVGDPVIAIGNPYGLTGSMTTGIVSALGRSISETQYAGGYAIANIIQTSTPINPGNSGGPLLNWNGTVVGITTAIVSNSQGLGFAVPSNTIRKELFDLVELGNYTAHSYLGVTGSDMDYDTAQSMHVNWTYGWLINSVVPAGPADKAGVKANDIIVGVNGTSFSTKVIDGDALTSYIEAYTLPGQTVTLSIVRANHMMSLPLVLGTRPPPS